MNTDNRANLALLDADENESQYRSMICRGSVSSNEGIPKDYLRVKLAGEGKFGKSWYCLPHSALEGYQLGADSDSEQVPQPINSQVCVVKVSKSHKTLPEAWVEAMILWEVQKAAHENNLGHNVPDLIAMHIPVVGLPSIAIEAVPGPTLACFLDQYMRSSNHWMPKAFVWHVFLQLGDILQLLHSYLKISHRDLHDGNIMLDPTRQDFFGLPNVVLIDFGSAYHHATVIKNPFLPRKWREQLLAETSDDLNDIEEDSYKLCGILHDLCEEIEPRDDDSEDWKAFKRFLAEIQHVNATVWDEFLDEDDCILSELMRRFREPAIAERTRISSTEVDERIREMIAEAMAQRDGGISDQEIQDAIELEWAQARDEGLEGKNQHSVRESSPIDSGDDLQFVAERPRTRYRTIVDDDGNEVIDLS